LIAPGGLGNQLFTLACALHLAEKRLRNITVLSDNKELVKRFNYIKRNVEIKPQVRVVFSNRFNFWVNAICSKLTNMSHASPRVIAIVGRYIKRMQFPWEFPFEIEREETPIPLVLLGYFQSVEFVENLSLPVKKFMGRFLGIDILRTDLENASRSIGVHIRRGDFHLVPEYGILAEKYFQSILHVIANKDSKVILASEDLIVLRKLAIFKNQEILDSGSYSPLETIIKLANTSELVMSNSTFSFWAGWAVIQNGGSVYCPRPWYKSYYVPKDFLTLRGFTEKDAIFE
jgi:hypothetical protein